MAHLSIQGITRVWYTSPSVATCNSAPVKAGRWYQLGVRLPAPDCGHTKHPFFVLRGEPKNEDRGGVNVANETTSAERRARFGLSKRRESTRRIGVKFRQDSVVGRGGEGRMMRMRRKVNKRKAGDLEARGIEESSAGCAGWTARGSHRGQYGHEVRKTGIASRGICGQAVEVRIGELKVACLVGAERRHTRR
ncbi:hypothetical protein C8F04DRAFT_1192664 [Mycena alexandri]|uniref:Uncharacterized protein n=1 Tax=Mycena alexandri TaxID=1745969 RepID=A0AAD6WT06_9AGAR|nr:hypothetical protein C8F04DRAFT_1192664 [Mycena alexandri]